MLKSIMFDLDDTLLWDEKSIEKAFEATCEIAVQKYNIDPKELERNVRSVAESIYPKYDTYEFVKNIGIGTFESFWGEFTDKGKDFEKLRDMQADYRETAWIEGLKALDIDDKELAIELAETFPKERRQHIYLYEETLDVLKQLKDNYKLLMLTNGAPSLQHEKLSLSPELAPYFDYLVISGEFGEGKPEPAIFEYSINLLEVNKNETIMVGNNPHSDILGATRTGIDSIWINHHNEKIEEVTPTYEVKRLKDIISIIKSRS
ncbi:MAG TPA: HAD family hydrolase [Pseudogracilibacillus sp.]|nr:HAD family hydrolase [Pseudogracilibacillus sp.]